MLASLLKRFANRTLQRRIAKLEQELEAARRTIRVLEAERETLALVLARDRARVQAELAAYARKQAEAEQP